MNSIPSFENGAFQSGYQNEMSVCWYQFYKVVSCLSDNTVKQIPCRICT